MRLLFKGIVMLKAIGRIGAAAAIAALLIGLIPAAAYADTGTGTPVSGTGTGTPVSGTGTTSSGDDSNSNSSGYCGC
jgi:hypothetical protein